MKNHWRNRIVPLLSAALLLLSAGCGRAPAVSTPAAATPSPTLTLATPAEATDTPVTATPSPTPESTPTPVPSAPPPTPEPTPAETPVSTPQQTPESTPEQTAEPTPTMMPEPARDEYDITELDGIAEPGDVLPIYETYEEARDANAAARADVSDVIGWITIPGTAIDYPVCQSDDKDSDYYLDHNVEGALSKHGAIYMDSRNAASDQQQHVLIYGHNMRNGTMFHDLMNYKQQAFFDDHRYISLYWKNTETVWQVYLASAITSTNVHFAWTRFNSGDHFAEFMGEMKAYAESVYPSIIDDSVTIGPNDQVLTLSICTYAPPEAKEQNFVVQARRIR